MLFRIENKIVFILHVGCGVDNYDGGSILMITVMNIWKICGIFHAFWLLLIKQYN